MWKQIRFQPCKTARFVLSSASAALGGEFGDCPACASAPLRYQGLATLRRECGNRALVLHEVPVFICSDYMCYRHHTKCAEYYAITPVSVCTATGQIGEGWTKLTVCVTATIDPRRFVPVVRIDTPGLVSAMITYLAYVHCSACGERIGGHADLVYARDSHLLCEACAAPHVPAWTPSYPRLYTSDSFYHTARAVYTFMYTRTRLPRELIFACIARLFLMPAVDGGGPHDTGERSKEHVVSVA